MNFANIWKDSQGNGKQSNPDILRLKKLHLFGLYDIALDLEVGGYLHYLKQIRHYPTHRYLLPHIEVMGRSDAGAPEYHINYDVFFQKTITLLQLVRSTIIYLVAFIDEEERKKTRGKESTIFLIYAYAYRPWQPAPHRIIRTHRD